MKYLLLIFKNVRRNLLRSLLTALGTMVLVLVVTMAWAVLKFLDDMTSEKHQNLKAIVSEKWQMPSQMPLAYATSLSEGAARHPGDLKPEDSMTWQFYGGTTDPQNNTPESRMFAFAMQPAKITTMMDELDSLPPGELARLNESVARLEKQRDGILMGHSLMTRYNKRVGDRLKLFGGTLSFKGIDLEFEIVGELPRGRYDRNAIMDREYLNAAIDAYKTANRKEHPQADRSLGLVWLRVRDKAAFTKIADQIANSPLYSNPAVKVETEASAISNFMEAFRTILWGMRTLLVPAVIVTLSLVIANAISISVRERRTEMAVMKVLGFQPWQLLLLVLGEALLLGAFAGIASGTLTYFVVNDVMKGLPLPIGFFPVFLIPIDALWWGAAVGTGTALAGSLLPAWSARSVKVSEVFAKVA